MVASQGTSLSAAEPGDAAVSCHCGVLTGQEILDKHLIENRGPGPIKPATYDLRLGNQVILCGTGEPRITDLAQLSPPLVTVRPFGTIIFQTQEVINTQGQGNIVGHFGLRVTLALQGLMLQVGPQVDPGYHGPLFGLLLNTTAEEIRLRAGETLLSIEFIYTTGPCGAVPEEDRTNVVGIDEYLVKKKIIWNSLVRGNIIQRHSEELRNATLQMGEIRRDILAQIADLRQTVHDAMNLRTAHWTLISAVVFAVLALAAAVAVPLLTKPAPSQNPMYFIAPQPSVPSKTGVQDLGGSPSAPGNRPSEPVPPATGPKPSKSDLATPPRSSDAVRGGCLGPRLRDVLQLAIVQREGAR